MRKTIYDKLIILFFFATSGLFAQIDKITVKSADTIDYMYLSSAEGYKLMKIMDLAVTVPHACSKDFRFYPGLWDSTLITTAKKSNRTLLKSDSLLFVGWFLIRKTECIPGRGCGHLQPFWKLNINRKSNVLILEKVFCVQAQDLKRILLKVIKLSEFEIILEDLNDKVWHRRYYFQKNY